MDATEPKKRDAERTHEEILQAAQRLFAERDISSVSVRDIAKEAGVSHGLVQQYFGTRKEMLSAVIRSEVQRFAEAPLPAPGVSAADLTALRLQLAEGMGRFRDYARVITRAEMAGIEPESMLDPAVPTPIMKLADAIEQLQAQSPQEAAPLDARWVSAYISASIFAFSTMTPWLIASAGLDENDVDVHAARVAEISVALIALALGVNMGTSDD